MQTFFQATIGGRVTRDAEVQDNGSFKRVNIGLVHNQWVYDAQQKKRVEQPLWLNVVAFGKLMERLQVVQKGDELIVFGSFTSVPSLGKDGSPSQRAEIRASEVSIVSSHKSDESTDDDEGNGW